MTSTPEVSVVMGVYNGDAHLRSTVESVLSQEDVALEFVIVDDGSTDETAEVLSEYAASDDRLRVLTQSNQGLTRALIAGCAAARGRYIARQDCGDISLPHRLSRQASVLAAHPDCAFVSSWTRVIGPCGEYLHTAKGTGLAVKPMSILSDTSEWGVIDGPSHHTSVMFKVDAYRDAGGYRAPFYFGQDWDLWFRLAARGTFCMLPEALCESRVSLDAISPTWRDVQMRYAAQSFRALRLRRQGLSDQAALLEAEQIQRPRPSPLERRRRRAMASYHVGRTLQRNGDARALSYLIGAVRHDPLFLRAWAALLLLPAGLKHARAQV